MSSDTLSSRPDSGEQPPSVTRRWGVRSPWRGRSAAWRALLIGVLLAGVALIAYGLAYLAAGDGVPRGSTVLGVDIGGQSTDDAVATLETQLAARTTAPLQVVLDGEPATVDPTAAGLSLDARATVESAGGRSANPVLLWRDLFGGGPVEPVIAVDDARLTAAVKGLADTYAREVRQGSVIFEGATPVAVAPVPGRALDTAEAEERIRDGYLAGDDPIALTADEIEPTVDQAEVERAIAEVAGPAMSAPIALAVGGTTVEVTPQMLATALTLVPDSQGRLQPQLDPAALEAALAPGLAAVEVAPRDARIEIVGGRPQVVPGVDGVQVAPDELATAVSGVLTAPAPRSATAGVATAEPDLTTAEAEALGVTEQLSSYRQAFPYAAYRVQNIGEAARRINGTLLEPGEVFSMNQTTKERTEANGYTVGFVISGGRLREELGGGVSTITTAMWGAAFYAGLERVEQRAHSFYISRYEPGLEATVDWGALDLRFRNDTGSGVLIQAESGRDFVTITMWGTKQYEVTAEFGPRTNIRPPETIYDDKAGCVPQDGVSGFDITVTRVFAQGGQVVRREPLQTSYNAADQIYCRPAPTG